MKSARSAIAWFEREDWPEIKKLTAGLQDTFDEWLAAAEQGIADVTAQGFIVQKVILKPSDLRQQYRATGRKIDGAGRAKMAAEKLVEAEQGKTVH